MTDAEKCDAEVYEKGESVFITHTISSKKLEEWVILLRERSGQRVDWHWMGGRAVFRALGDLDKVRQAIVDELPFLDAAFVEAMQDSKWYDPAYDKTPACFITAEGFVPIR